MKKIRLMIVDDDPHICNLIKLTFESSKYEVFSAYSGKECLRTYTENTIVYILDIMMAPMDGYLLCEKLREKNKNCVIVMLSAKNKINDKLKAVESGADDYITKPFCPIDIENRVQRSLSDKREKWKK
jgi:two-component system OmpR family response regulator